MTNEPANDDAALDEQLVAYLDGELDPQSSRRVEDLLATDPEVRGKLQRLDRTWEMLDELDRPPTADRFTQTTMEMVAVAAEQDIERLQAEAPRRRRRRWLAVVAGVLVAGLTGYAVVAALLPDPNRDLIRDLPVLQNLDQYRRIDSMEFLRDLHEEGVVPVVDDSPAVARRPIAEMNEQQKADLLQRQGQFERMGSAKQQELHKLHDAIERQPDADELRETMRHYSQWLKTLPTYRRMPLLEMDPEERIEEIKRLLAEQQQQLARQRDAEGVFRWMQAYAEKHAEHLMRGMPGSARRKTDDLDPTVRRRWLIWMAWRHLQSSRPGRPAALDEEDLNDLRAAVSPETASQLESMPADQQRRAVVGMIRLAFHHKLAARNLRGPWPEEHEKQLDQFFDEMDPEDRDHLLSLPGDEMMRELRKKYLTESNAPRLPGPRPGGSPRDKPPGRGQRRPP